MFDEETATEVIKSYLKLIRDADLPEESKLTFKNCQFDSDTGISKKRTLTFNRDKVIFLRKVHSGLLFKLLCVV